uniref:Sterile alpha motif domain-containing protein 15 n=1 Tax=Ceratitis capitata TaxID=7213 RepID=W8BBF8_CERCA
MSVESWHKFAPHHVVRTSGSMNRRGIYSLADEKFLKPTRKPFQNQLETFSYRTNIHHANVQRIRRYDMPIEFKASPDTLLTLAARVVDRFPLPKVYEWTTFECCKWMREYGYPQYQNTLRVNLITGRRLLLLDAQSLSAINIKDFNHIKHIAHGIRQLFYFEMTKFARSIALPPQYHLELYKLFRVKTGPRYDATRPTDLWRQLQLLREVTKPARHWDLLEHWLMLRPDSVEMIGGAPRRKLYRCKVAEQSNTAEPPERVCECQHYCNCKFTPAYYKEPSVLSVLKPFRTKKLHTRAVGCSMTCLPPCTCNWPSRYYQFNEVLNYLTQNLPVKYSFEARRRAHTLSSVYRGSIVSCASYGK